MVIPAVTIFDNTENISKTSNLSAFETTLSQVSTLSMDIKGCSSCGLLNLIKPRVNLIMTRLTVQHNYRQICQLDVPSLWFVFPGN